MNFFKKIIGKLKGLKNKELYLAVLLGVIAVIVVFASSTNVGKTVEDTSDFDEYISAMENKICSVIEKMEGCSRAQVVISCASLEEKVYAYETVVETVNGTTTESSSIVTVKGEPLVVKNLPPTICGVVVVADGADDPVLRMKIKQAVVTLLGVSADQVQVFTYKS